MNVSYDPARDGAVVAVRIYYGGDVCFTPMAELAFAFGGTVTFEWTNVNLREYYSKGINGYTFIFDERLNRNGVTLQFSDFVKRKEDLL